MKKLTEAQRNFYENALKMAKEEIEFLNAEIQRELAAVKERISKINEEIKAVKKIYEGACARLGIESDIDSLLSGTQSFTTENETKKTETTETKKETKEEEEISAEDFSLEDELLEVEDDEELEY